MQRRARKDKRELGQAAVEFSIIIPFVLMLMATVVDLGTYAVRAASIETASANVAHQIEANPSMTEADAVSYVKSTYPLFGDDVTVTLGKPDQSSQDFTYHLYKNASDGHNIPSKVVSTKEDVTVSFTGTWVMPWSAAVSGNPDYTISKTTTATTDQTWQDWKTDGTGSK